MRIALEGTLETTVLFICLVFCGKIPWQWQLKEGNFFASHSFRMLPVVEGKSRQRKLVLSLYAA